MIQEVGLALTAAGSSAVILEFLRHFLNKRIRNADVEIKYRDQFNKDTASLREEVGKLKADAKLLEDDADEWRKKYWELVSEYNAFKIKTMTLLIQHNVDVSHIDGIKHE